MNPGIRLTTSGHVRTPKELLGSPFPVPMPERAWHVEALDWADRVRRNSGSVSDNTLATVSRFCRAVDAAEIRPLIFRLNPFAGNSLPACLVPLYLGPRPGSVLGNATDTNVNFVSDDFRERGLGAGLKGGDGVVKYLNTGLVTNRLPGTNSVHLSISATGLSVSVDRIIIGTFNNGSPGLMCIDENNSSSYGANGGRAARLGTFTGGAFPFTKQLTAEEKHLIASRDRNTSCNLFRNGQAIARSTANLALGLTSNIPWYVFALNAINQTPTATSPATVRMYSIGLGMDGTQAAAFSAAVMDFNDSLGR